MPADGTVSGLHLGQTLPLMKPFFLNVSPNLTIANATANSFQIGQFTMPFYGDMVFQGSVQLSTNAAGVQAPIAQIYSLSTPSPISNPQSTWRTEGGTGYGQTQIPLLANWTAIAAGTVVTVLGLISNGSGGVGVTVNQATGIMFCTKT